jgi:hypothetical protein
MYVKSVMVNYRTRKISSVRLQLFSKNIYYNPENYLEPNTLAYFGNAIDEEKSFITLDTKAQCY